MSNADPSSTPTQVVKCVKSIDGKLWLACVVKRTYMISGSRLVLADEQVPVLLEPDIETDEHDRYRTLRDDADVIAPKVATDVIVVGCAHAPRRVREMTVSVALGGNARVLRVLGERRAEVSIEGRVRFSSPEPFESVPLSWDLAYGGYDAYAQDELDPPERRNGKRVEASPRDEGVFAYPRNKVGRGYFLDVDRDRADGALLPQIEDPGDVLTPERFFVPTPGAWIDAPASAGVGWMPHAWYPRMMRCLGAFLEHDPPGKPIREMAFADGADLQGPFRKNEMLVRGLQGAAPGMACERLRGDEMVILRGMRRGQEELRFSLPGEVPTLEVRASGAPKAFTPEAVLQTVKIDASAGTVTMVWCGTARLLGVLDEGSLRNIAISSRWTSVA